MNARYEIHPDEGYSESCFEGGVTLLDFATFVQKVWADPRWRAELDGLMDFSNATIEMTDEELQKLMKSMLKDARCSLARWAFVVRTADTFGWLRKVDVLSAQQSTFRIFFSRKEAEEWLLQPRVKGNPGR
jgi:hypothetical protein